MEEYLCALYKKILLQGRMYVFQNHVCFYSNVFGYTKVKTIALKDVTIVNRAYTAQVVFNAIEIVHKGKCEFFTSFIFPTRTYTTHARLARVLEVRQDFCRPEDALGRARRRAKRRRRRSKRRSAIVAGGEGDARRGRPAATANDAHGRNRRTRLGGVTLRIARRGTRRRRRSVLVSATRTLLWTRASPRLRRPPSRAASTADAPARPRSRLASSPVLAAASAGGEELDEPSALRADL